MHEDGNAAGAAAGGKREAEGAVPGAQASATGSERQIALVTGASSGMGREFARQLARRADVEEVWLVARREDALAETAGELGVPARIIAADLAREEGVQAVRDALERGRPRVRFLVNAAGYGAFGDTLAIDEEAELGMIDLNCRALVALTRAALPHMGRGDRVIELCSASAFTPLPRLNVYAATKAFVLAYSRALRFELAGTGVGVCAVCPAWVDTAFGDRARQTAQPQAVRHLLLAQRADVVVRRAIRASVRGRACACCGPVAAFMRIACKVAPRGISMTAWEGLRRL